MRRFLCLLLLFLLPLTACGASMHTEVENSSLDLEVRLGYNGAWTYGKAMPVSIHVCNHGQDFEGTIALNTYVSPYDYNRYETALSLPSGSEKQVDMTVTVQSKQDRYTVEVLSGTEVVRALTVEPGRILNPSALLIGVMSDKPEVWSFMDILPENDELYRGEYWQTIALTPDTFPASTELMSAFSMLVVDGTDLTAMSAEKQAVLEKWIRGGGLVLLSGGPGSALSRPFFSSMTGLASGAAVQSDPTPALLSTFSLADAPLDRELSLYPAEGAAPVIASGETGLVWRTPVNAGVVYTLAFDPGTREFAAWAPAHVLFQRLLLREDTDLYMYMTGSQYRSSQELPYMYGTASEIPLKESRSLLPALLVIPVMLIAALLAALYLRRHDRQSLMWAVYPLLALAACAVMYGISLYAPTNRPLALSVITLDTHENGGTLRQSTVLASAGTGEHFVHADDALTVTDQENYYDYYEDDRRPDEPTHLNLRFVSGDRTGIGYSTSTAWEPRQLYSQRTFEGGSVTGSIWMEKDGLHGQVENLTGLSLPAGAVFTAWGFADIPALAPGEQASFAMLRGTVKDKKNPMYPAGTFFTDISDSDIVYALIDEYIYRVSENGTQARSTQDPEKYLQSSMLQSLVPDSDSYQGNTDLSRSLVYITFPDQIPASPLTLDGREVTRSAHRSVIFCPLSWQSVGPTGVFYRMPGQDQAVRWEVDENLMPGTHATASSGYARYYHTLSENPTFCFDLSGIGDITLTALNLHTRTYGSPLQAWILNQETQQWDRCELDADIAHPETYLSRDGQLFVQFRPDTNSGQYMDIPTPTISLEGMCKDA